MPNEDLIFTSLDALNTEDDLVFTSLDGIKQKKPAVQKLPANLSPQQVKRFLSQAGKTITDTEARELAGMVSGKSLEEATTLAGNYLRPKPQVSQMQSQFQPMQAEQPVAEQAPLVAAPQPGTGYTGEQGTVNFNQEPDFGFNRVGQEIARPKSQAEIEQNISQTMLEEYKGADKDLKYIFDAIDNGKLSGSDLNPFAKIAMGLFTDAEVPVFNQDIYGYSREEIAAMNPSQKEALKEQIRAQKAAEKTSPLVTNFATIKAIQEESTKNIAVLNNEVLTMLQDPLHDKALLKKKTDELYEQINLNQVSNFSEKPLEERQLAKNIKNASAAVKALPLSMRGYIATKNAVLAAWETSLPVLSSVAEFINKTSDLEQTGDYEEGERKTTRGGDFLDSLLIRKRNELEQYRKSNKTEYLAGQMSILDGLNAVNVGTAIGQTVGSMGAVIGGSMIGGGFGGAAVGYSLVYGDAVKAAREAGYSETEAEIYGQLLAVGSGLLEELPVGKLLDGWTNSMLKRSVMNTIRAELRAGVPKNQIYKKVIEQTLETAAKGVQQGLPEAFTEIAQGGQEYFTQIAFNNYLKDKEDPGFDVPSLRQFGRQSLEAGILGFFGGGGASMVGDVFSGSQSYSKLARAAINDNETFNNLNLIADGLLTAGKITQQQRDSFVDNLKIAKEAKAALPKYVKNDDVRQRSIELILQKKRLEADMATVDPSMQDGYKAKLVSIQSELKSIADQKWKAPANAVVFTTVSGMEAMTTDLINNSSKENAAGTFVSTVESGKGFISTLIKSLENDEPLPKAKAERTVASLEALAKSFAEAPVKTEMTQKAAKQAQELADQVKQYSNITESAEQQKITGLDFSPVADRISLSVPISELDSIAEVPADIQEAYQGIMNGDDVSPEDANNVQDVLYEKYKDLNDIKDNLEDRLENTTSENKQKKLSESINAIKEMQRKLSDNIDMVGKYRDETAINDEASGKKQVSKTKPVVREELAQEETQTEQKPSREQKTYSEQELADMEYDYSNPSDDVASIIDNQPDASKIYKFLNNAIKFINKIAPNVKIYVHSTTQDFYDAVYSTSGKNEHNLSDDAAFVMGKDGKPKAIHFNLAAMLGKKNPKQRAEALRTFAHEAMHAGLHTIFGDDQKLFKSFQDKLSKVLGSADLAFLDNFIENYRDPNKQDVTAEEFLAELGGMMSAEGRKIPKPILSRIAQLINNTIVSAARKLGITVDSNLLFKDTMDTNDVIDFFNTMAESTQTGITQGVQAKAEPLLKQQTKQANEAEQPTGTRTTARKTDTDTDAQVLFTVATKRAFDIGTKILKGYTEKYDDLVKMEYKEVFKMGADKFNKLFNETANYALVNYTEILKSNIPRYKAKLNVGMPFLGSWEGFYEPSMNLNISISDETDTSKLSDLFNLISEKTSQDAYIVEMVSDLDDAFQKDPNKLQLFEYQGNGISVYPQVIAKFPREITPFERSQLAQKMTEAKFDSFSIGPDFVKISVFDNGISDDENTDREKEREDRIAFFNDQKSIFEKAVKGNNLYSQGVKFSTQIKRSAFVAGKKTGENELQRKYDRRDVFEAFKPSNAGSTTRARKSGESGPARGNRLFNQPLTDATTIANKYYESTFGRKAPNYTGTRFLDKAFSKRISDAYVAMKHDPQNLEVAKAYRQLIKETIDQYEEIIAAGYEVVMNDNEAYPSSADMIDDLRNNKSMKIFSTEAGFGDNQITDEQRRDNPLLAKTKYKDVNGRPLLANDIFRFVHDFFGHAKLGNSFGAKGEENAWNVHARMYSPLARKAATTELRGQNSYFNFSGANDKIQALREKGKQQREDGDLKGAEETTNKIYEISKFAEQKVGLLPEEFNVIDETDEGDRQEELGLPVPTTRTTRARATAKAPKDIAGRVGREGGLINGTNLQVTGKEQIKPGKTTFTIYEAPTAAQKEKGNFTGKRIETFGLEDIKKKAINSNSAIVNRAEMLSSGLFKYKYEEIDENNKKTGKKISGEYPLPYSNPKANKNINKLVRQIKAIPGKNEEEKAEKKRLLTKLKKEIIPVYQDVINTMAENIRALFDTLTPEFIEQSKRWYEGANRFANSLASTYKISVEQSSGMLAVLSPQKDWFNNVSAAERVMDIITNHSDKPFTKELLDNAVKYNTKGGKVPNWVNDIKKQFKTTEGMSINDMQREGKSMAFQANLLRILDHYYNSPNVLQTTPDGQVIGYGESTIMWNPASEIGRAMMIFRDPAQAKIDVLLGEGNKVRNFYNNIVDPNSENGYLTADTHALGVAFGLPTSANDAGAFKLFSGGEESIYAIVKDAYTMVAKEKGMLPRELQSITWEAFRTGVNDKNRTKAKNKSNFDMMQAMRGQGVGPYKITQAIINENRSTDPEWAKELGINTQKRLSEILKGTGREAQQGVGEDVSVRGQQRERDGGADTSVVPDAARETVTRARRTQTEAQVEATAKEVDALLNAFIQSSGGYAKEDRISANSKRSETQKSNYATKKLENLLGFDIGNLPSLTEEQKTIKNNLYNLNRLIGEGRMSKYDSVKELVDDYKKSKSDGTNPELVKAVEESLPSQGTTTRARRTQDDNQYYDPDRAADKGTGEDRKRQQRIYDIAKAFVDKFNAEGGDRRDMQTELDLHLQDMGYDLNVPDLTLLVDHVTNGKRPEYIKNQGGEGYYSREGQDTRKSRVLDRIITKLSSLGRNKQLNKRIVNELKKSLRYTVENQEDAMRVAQLVVDEFGGVNGPQDVQDLFDLSNEFSGAVKTFIVGNVLNEAYRLTKKSEKGSEERAKYQKIVDAAANLLAERARENGREIAALYRLYLNSPEGMYTVESQRFLQDVQKAFGTKRQQQQIDKLTKELKDAREAATRAAAASQAVQAASQPSSGGTRPARPPRPPKPRTEPLTDTQENLKKERTLFQKLKDRLKSIGGTRARRQYPAGVDAEVVDILAELARVNFKRGIFNYFDIKDAITDKLAKDNITISVEHFQEMWDDIWREAAKAEVAYNADKLAKRIIKQAQKEGPAEAPMTDPIKLIKDELFKRATQDLEQFEDGKETEFDKLRRLLFNYESRTKPIWDAARAAVEQQIEDLDSEDYSDRAKAELKAKLDSFFNDTLADALPRSRQKITDTFQEDVKNRGLKIQAVLLKSNEIIAANKEEFVNNLTDRLVENTFMSDADARAIAEAFSNEYDMLVQKTSEKLLSRNIPTFKSTSKILKKSSAEKAFEMIKYGAIDIGASITDADGNLTDLNVLFAEIFGLPQITTEIRDNLLAFAEQIAKTKPDSILRQQYYNDMMSYMEFQKIRDVNVGSVLMAQIYNNVLLSLDTMTKAFNSNLLLMPVEYLTQVVRASFDGDFSLIPLLSKAYFGRKGDKKTEVYFREGFNNAKLTLAGMVETEKFNTVNIAEIYSKQNDSPALAAWGKYARKAGRFLGAIDTLLTSAAANARLADLLYDEIKYQAKLNGIKLSSKEIADAVSNILGIRDDLRDPLQPSPLVSAITEAKAEFEEIYGLGVNINDKDKIRLFRARVMEIVREEAKGKTANYLAEKGINIDLDQATIEELKVLAKELASKIGLMGNPPGSWGALAAIIKLPGLFAPGSQTVIGNMFANAPMNAADKILQGNTLIGGGVLMTRLMKNQRGVLNSREVARKFYDSFGIRTEMYGRTTSTKLGGRVDVNMEKKEMIARYTMVQLAVLPLTYMSVTAITGAIAKALEDDEEKREEIIRNGIVGVGKIPENERHMLFYGDKTAKEGSEEYEGQWKKLGLYVTGPMYGYTAPGSYSKMTALKSMYGVEPYCIYSYGRLLTRYNDNPILAAVFGSVGANSDVILFNNNPEKPSETWTDMAMMSAFLQMSLVKDQAAIKPIMELVDAASAKGVYSTPELEGGWDRASLLLQKKFANIVSNVTLPAELKNLNQDIKSILGMPAMDPRTFREFMIVRAPIMDLLINQEKTDSFGFPIEEKTKRVLPVPTQGLMYVRDVNGNISFPQVDQIMNGAGAKYYALFQKYGVDKYDKPDISNYVEIDPNNTVNSKVVTLTIDQRNQVRDEYKKIMREFCDTKYNTVKSGTKAEFDIELGIFLGFYNENPGGYKDYIIKKVIGPNAFVNKTVEELVNEAVYDNFRERK